MSWVAEENAANTKRSNVKVNSDIGTCVEVSGEGNVRASSTKAADTNACIMTIHQRLVRNMSTSGLHSGLSVHGRYNRLVNSAISPFGTPIFVNIVTEMLLTMKYGMPSAKYNVGIHHQGDLPVTLPVMEIMGYWFF